MSIKNFIQQLVGTKKIVIENVQLKDNDMIIIAHTPKKNSIAVRFVEEKPNFMTTAAAFADGAVRI